MQQIARLIQYLRDIPKDLLYIFSPIDDKGIKDLEDALELRAINRTDRRAVYDLYQKYKDKLPLKAQRYTLKYLTIQTRLIDLRKKNKDDRQWKDKGGGY